MTTLNLCLAGDITTICSPTRTSAGTFTTMSVTPGICNCAEC